MSDGDFVSNLFARERSGAQPPSSGEPLGVSNSDEYDEIIKNLPPEELDRLFSGEAADVSSFEYENLTRRNMREAAKQSSHARMQSQQPDPGQSKHIPQVNIQNHDIDDVFINYGGLEPQSKFLISDKDGEQKLLDNELVDFITFGKVKSTVSILGHTLIMETINMLDTISVIDEVSKYSQGARLAAHRIGILARAIKHIDGKKSYPEQNYEIGKTYFVKDSEMKAWLSKMQPPLIEELFQRYLVLEKRQSELMQEIKKS